MELPRKQAKSPICRLSDNSKNPGASDSDANRSLRIQAKGSTVTNASRWGAHPSLREVGQSRFSFHIHTESEILVLVTITRGDENLLFVISFFIF